MDFWYDLITSPTIILTALLIGTFGEIVKRSINSKQVETEVVAYRDRGIVKVGSKPVNPEAPVPSAPPLWKRFYFYTLPAQPVMAGLLLGLVPWLPAADALSKPGYDFAAHLGTYGFAGVICKIGYDTIISTGKRMIREKAGLPASESSVPPPPATETPKADPPADPPAAS